ncbi:MAG: DUF3307 domain-containing protein [Polaribacter sp.]
MILFLKLLLAHLLGDFVFQPENWVNDKEKNKIKSSKLYIHILIHSILLMIILGFDFKNYWIGFLIIVSSHYIIDVSKIYFQKKKTKRIWFFIDQFLHLLILVLVTFMYLEYAISLENILTNKNLLLIVCLISVTYVAAILIKVIITQWNPKNNKENTSSSSSNGNESLAKAGRYIGILERLLIFVFIATKHWEAIGFLLAAKSIFRFGDLTDSEDRKLTEYILIGTLLSFGFAIFIGLLYVHLSKII